MTISLDSFIAGSGRLWVSGETIDQYEIVKSPAASGALYIRTTAAGSGATDPASDTTNYRPFGARPIKSIQRGTISIGGASAFADVAITSVDTSKTELRFLGGDAPSGSEVGFLARLALTSATNVRATRQIVTAGVTNVSWELTEYY